MANLQVFPYVKTPEGAWSIHDNAMSAIWMQLESEGKVEHLFYDGSVRDLTGWLQFIKMPNIHVVVIADLDKKIPVHLSWVSDIDDFKAWLHHCAVGPYKRGAWEVLRDYWLNFPFLHILMGLTPATNTKALKITVNICKWTVVGEIPGVCNLVYEGRRVPGVVTYFKLREIEGEESWEKVEEKAAVAI